MANQTENRSLLRLLIAGVVIAMCSIAVILSVSMASLDQEIRTRFAGVRWTLPAQVYAAPQELYAGLNLSLSDLSRELHRLGYRQENTLSGAGSYTVAADHIDIASRAFNFYDGAQAATQMRVQGGDSITSVTDLQTKADLEIIRLDPLLIGSIYPAHGGEDRVLVKVDEIPQRLKDGLIAVEDRNFYSHFGISIRGILRAIFTDLTQGKLKQGASTITQQLVKNFFLTSERSYKRKFKEIQMALLLEAHYSKNEILEAYFNEIYMGQDGGRAVHGFGLASQFYFNKPIAELKTHEMAMLVGIVKGPSVYDPRRHPDLVLERRNLVLSMWKKAGLISDTEHASAKVLPLSVVGKKNGGAVRYPIFVDLVKRQLKEQYPEEAILSEGLRIYTTLNPKVQETLENRIITDMNALEKKRGIPANSLQAAGVVTGVEGGEVQALVGDRNVRFAGYNRAIDSHRSIGSLAKPFVYLTALSHPDRYNLASPIDDQAIEVPVAGGKVWHPQNYDHLSHGQVPLYSALAHSYNQSTVRLGMDVGVAEVQKTFADAGFSKTNNLPSLFLGAIDMAPIEVAQIYNTLATNGYQTPLTSIREVLTKEGTPLKRYPFKVKQTIEEGPVFLTTWALRKVLQIGTAKAAYEIVNPDIKLAGKTGTTDDLRDSWFAGYSADHVGVIWVGRDDYKTSGLTGANGAMPIWARLMRDLNAKSLDDTLPAEMIMADLACNGVPVPVMEQYASTQANCVPSAPKADTNEEQLDAPVVDGEPIPTDSPAVTETPKSEKNNEPPAAEKALDQPSKTDEPPSWIKDIF